MDSLPVKYLSLILLLIAALQFTNPVLIPVVPCGSDMPLLVNHTTPMVTLTSRYENCSIETNKSTYYLSKEEKGVVLTCKSQVPNRWVWNQIEESVKMVEVEKERLEVNGSVVFSSKLNVHFAEIINPDSFNFSCTNEIEYKYGEYPITCVTVQATVDNDANSLGPFKLSVLENIDSLPNCILNAKRFRTNCSINLAVDMSNITGICTSAGEPKSRMCEDLDHCKSLIYINAENETCNAELQTFNATLKNQKSLINHANSPQIAFCQVLFDHYPRWPSFLLLYPSFGKREWKNFDYYANMTEALGNNSIQLFALSQQNMTGNQTITTMRNEFAEDENVDFFCRAIFFLYMKGFRLRLGSADSNGTVVEDQKQNPTYMDKYNRFYTFSQNISLNTKKYGNISWISCDGPVWNSRDWFSSTMNISIYRMTSTAERPYVKLNRTVTKNVTTFACTYGGWPRPTVTWAFSELVKFSYKSGHLPDSQSYNTTWSQIRVIRNRESSFNVTCTVENFVGSTSQFITIKGLAEPRVLTKVVFIAVGCSVAGILIIAVVLFVIYRRYREKLIVYNPSQELTEAEIEEFYNGETVSNTANYEALELPYNNDYEIKQKDLEMDGSILGSGQFGIVLKGNIGPLTVAVKTVKPTADIIYLKSLLSELKILQYVGVHPNIVNLIGADTTNIKKREVLLVLDYCSNGSLLSFLRQSRERFEDFYANSGPKQKKQWPLYENSGGTPISTRHLLAFAYEIASAMDHLARKKVIHGDLAARNVLVTGDFHAKVCDFGLAKQLLHYSVYVQKVDCPLPLRWMSIESLQDMEFSLASDRWSYGVCLWEVFSLAEIPYPGEQWSFESYKMLLEGYRMAKPTYANNSLYRLMLQCWDAQPECRPPFTYIVDELRKEENLLTNTN